MSAPSLSRLVASCLAAALLVAACAGPAHVSAAAGWRIAQVLPFEPGGGPNGGYSLMTSVAAVGMRGAWATGVICPTPCGRDRLVVEHWDGTRWQEIPSPPSTGAYIHGAVIGASSAGNAWVFADTVGTGKTTFFTRASWWNGRRWASFSFPGNSRTKAAAVFSRTDAWAFAETIRLYVRPYVVRFNGRRWLRVASPLVPKDASAPAPDDIWIVGPLTEPAMPWAAARWNGKTWRTLRFPDLHLPPRAEIGNAAIEAVSARDVWVCIGLSNGIVAYPGIIVLHWNGQAWSRVTVPYRTLLVGDITQDGRGGIWIFAAGPPTATGPPVYLDHYRNGHWSRQRAPAQGGHTISMGLFSWNTHAGSGWAATDTYNAPNQGLLLRYGP